MEALFYRKILSFCNRYKYNHILKYEYILNLHLNLYYYIIYFNYLFYVIFSFSFSKVFFYLSFIFQFFYLRMCVPTRIIVKLASESEVTSDWLLSLVWSSIEPN